MTHLLTKTPPNGDQDVETKARIHEKERIHHDVTAQDCQLTCLGYCRYACGGCWTSSCVGHCASFCGRVSW